MSRIIVPKRYRAWPDQRFHDTDYLPVIETIRASQPPEWPRYRAPLWQWLARLFGWALFIVLFVALVCGPALALNK